MPFNVDLYQFSEKIKKFGPVCFFFFSILRDPHIFFIWCKRKILAKLHSDITGKHCLKDAIFQRGKKIYQTHVRKVDKQVELQHTVKDHMRLLGRLYGIYRDHEGMSTPYRVAIEDFFIRAKFYFL